MSVSIHGFHKTTSDAYTLESSEYGFSNWLTYDYVEYSTALETGEVALGLKGNLDAELVECAFECP